VRRPRILRNRLAAPALKAGFSPSPFAVWSPKGPRSQNLRKAPRREFTLAVPWDSSTALARVCVDAGGLVVDASTGHSTTNTTCLNRDVLHRPIGRASLRGIEENSGCPRNRLVRRHLDTLNYETAFWRSNDWNYVQLAGTAEGA
jgi:hypothetical protein